MWSIDLERRTIPGVKLNPIQWKPMEIAHLAEMAKDFLHLVDLNQINE